MWLRACREVFVVGVEGQLLGEWGVGESDFLARAHGLETPRTTESFLTIL